MNEEMLATASAIVEENNALTLVQINAEMRRRLPNSPFVTISTLSNALRVSTNMRGIGMNCHFI